MDKEDESELERLRSKALRIAQKQPAPVVPADAGIKEVLHELQVHQIELQMQNEELRSAQIAMEASRKKYSDLFDFAPIGYFVLDARGNIVDINLTGASLVGVERIGLIKRHFARYVCREDRDRFYLAHHEMVSARERKQCDVTLLRVSTQDDFPAQLLMDPVSDPGGGVIGCRIAVLDITAQREAEKKAGLARFPEENPFPVLRINQEGTILYSNRPGEALLETWGSKPGGQAPARWRTLAAEALASGRHRVDEASCGDKVFSFILAPVAEGGYVNLYGRDVTKQKEFDAVLQASEQRFHRMFERNKAAMLVIEPASGSIVDANAAAAAFYGYSRDQLCGMNITAINLLPAEAVAAERQKAAEEERHYFVFPHRLSDGQTRWVEVFSSPFEVSGQSLLFSIIHDITERKRLEDALQASEERVRRKLESILLPEGDIGSLSLADIIDVPSIHAMMEDFYALTHIPMAIIDMDDKTLVGVGWQEICTQFHRLHPETCAGCLDSDLELSSGAKEGDFKLYKCRNNMWDAATPIIIGGKKMGNLFTGQFFFDDEQPDYALFRAQAKRYGFNEAAYLAALDKVPRLSRETVQRGMRFLRGLAGMISQLSYGNVKLTRLIEDRKRAEAALRESEERFRSLVTASSNVMYRMSADWSEMLQLRGGGFLADTETPNRTWLHEYIHPDDQTEVMAVIQDAIRTHRIFEMEHRVLRVDGRIGWTSSRAVPLLDANGEIIEWFGAASDITPRKQAEEAVRASYEEISRFNRLAVDRELRMIELKTEINALCEQAGLPPRYAMNVLDGTPAVGGSGTGALDVIEEERP